MTRDEILNKLTNLRFCVVWPCDDWRDIGFTERPIWINSFGYGYFADDDPCCFTIIDGITNDDISRLKRDIETNVAYIDEIKKTPFNNINLFDDDKFLEDNIDVFLQLPNCIIDGKIFCGEDVNGWHFYTTEEELIAAFDRKDDFPCGGEYWTEMDDDLLSIWYERIFVDPCFSPNLPLTLTISKS